MRTNKDKKIVIIGKLPPPIMGPAIATKILLNSGLKDKFELVHFDTTINKTITTQGEFSFLKIFKSINLYFSFWTQMRKEKPDLIVLTSISQSVIGFLKDMPYLVIPRLFNIKVVGQLRGSNFRNILNKASWLVKGLMKWVLKNTSGIIVLGNNLRYIFENILPPNKIFVVPNGGNYSFPNFTKSNEKIRVLYLANLYPSKGVESVVDAAMFLNNPSCEFVFAGGWRNNEHFKKRLLKKIESSDLDITVLPPISGNEKFRLFASADIFVFPPIEPEGHPWVIVEAMAAGLPIISTDQGAIIESVIDGENGFIVKPNNPTQISEKIKLLIDNPQLRKRMGDKSKKFHSEKFTIEKVVENFSYVFTKVLKLN